MTARRVFAVALIAAVAFNVGLYLGARITERSMKNVHTETAAHLR